MFEYEKTCPFTNKMCTPSTCALGAFGNTDFTCSIKEYLYTMWSNQEEIKEKLDKIIYEIKSIS